MRITTLLSPERIRVGLAGADKQSAIDGTLSLLEGDERVVDMEEVRSVVLERESQMSTGVGKGLGLPHGKSPSVKSSVAALAVTREPVDFNSFDGEPVRIIFLLVGPPDAQSTHIRTLSRISRIMNSDSFRERVLAATSAEDVFTLIAGAEKAIEEE